MRFFLELCHAADLTGLLTVVVALLAIGHRVSGRAPGVRTFCSGGAALTFVTYMGLHLVSGALYGDRLSEATVRGLLIAGLVLGAGWILLPIMASIHDTTSGALIRKYRSWRFARVQEAEARRRYQQAEDYLRRRETERIRTSPEQERSQQEAAAQAQQAQRRREDARARVELRFALYGPDLKDRFPRTTLSATS